MNALRRQQEAIQQLARDEWPAMIVTTTDHPGIANCQQCGSFLGEGTVRIQQRTSPKRARTVAWYCPSCARYLGYTW
ncbi:hypothetical protein [Microbacterium sp. NPDC096154]|uniref:hypothetical protein n=1 Tax=Microbacterium sp. NPDC096154 TaxID=3155549 RepID=UPI00331EAF9E